MMVLEHIKGLPMEELIAKMVLMGHPVFRARQLFRWIYQKREGDFLKMTDLSKTFREQLSRHFALPSIQVDQAVDSGDGTVKYLMRLEDGQKVETVFIPTEDRSTLCVSTQVGCKMACSFCATGHQGFTRHLMSWEIVDQVLMAPTPAPVTNIVYMGMGEPFDNYDEVIKSLKILQDPMGPKIGKRHITVSTVGVVSRIGEFLGSNLGNLAISLHGTTDEQRSAIMPVNRRHTIGEIMDICRNVTLRGRKRITFEYLLIDGINDSDRDARRLVDLVKGIACKINLLAYNEIRAAHFKRPSEKRILAFQNILLGHLLTATYRRSRGWDIAAACGQLKTEHPGNVRNRHGA